MAGVKNEIYAYNRGGASVCGGDTGHYKEKSSRKRIFKE